jgi:nucleoside-diphosphate-sugar epimerase
MHSLQKDRLYVHRIFLNMLRPVVSGLQKGHTPSIRCPTVKIARRNPQQIKSMPESTPFGDAHHRSGNKQIPKRQRIVVLGASGFIGRSVVEKLAASDWALPVAISHRTALDLAIPVETVRLDARQPAALQAVLLDAAGVVNCITGDSETIIASAGALFATCSRMTPLPRIVHLSTMMVYGSATGTVDETAALRGDWDAYSAAKTEVEQMARTCRTVVHLRPGIVYGPRSPIWSGRIGRWLRQHRLGDLGVAGAGFCNLVHVDDVVEAVDRALRTPGIEGEAFNLSLPSPPTWNDYFCQFAAALGAALVPISRIRIILEQHVLAPPLKIAEKLSPILPFRWRPPDPIRPWLLRLCSHPMRMDVRKAERMLGIEWTPLDKGLRESAAWVLAREKAETA